MFCKEIRHSITHPIEKMRQLLRHKEFELHCDKTYKMACAHSEDSDQPGHPPSLISVFAMHLMGS